LKIWLDGALVDDEAARVSVWDHGFLLGDGVFETLRIYRGDPFALEEHLLRLRESAAEIGIRIPEAAQLEAAARDVLRANDLTEARMRITVTGGSGPPGLARGGGPPTILVVALPLMPWPPTSTAVISRLRRDEQSPLAGVKTTSLAESVIAFAEARESGADEALLLNIAGDLCEATTANVFVVRRGAVETPALESGCLAGITRDHVLRLCVEHGIEAHERRLAPAALAEADEAFLTSSTREVQALVAVDGRPVGSGELGPLTRGLAEAYSAMVRASLG
jgi:branched-chain amino acid aminotransferase